MSSQYFTSNQNKIFPLMTTFIYLSLITTGLLNLLQNHIASHYLQYDFVAILKGYQVWRIFSNNLNEPSRIGLLILLGFSYHFMARFERKNGTVVLFTAYLIYNMLFTLFLSGFMAIFYYFGLHFNVKIGFLFLWFNMLYKFCHFNRLSTITFFSVPTRLLPPILLLIIMVVDMEIRIDGIAGLTMSFLQCLIFRGGFISFTKETYTDKESLADCIALSKLCCWCKLYPENLIMSELAVIEESQFYEDLDPENPTHFEEYSIDAERIMSKERPEKQMEKDFDEGDNL